MCIRQLIIVDVVLIIINMSFDITNTRDILWKNLHVGDGIIDTFLHEYDMSVSGYLGEYFGQCDVCMRVSVYVGEFGHINVVKYSICMQCYGKKI